MSRRTVLSAKTALASALMLLACAAAQAAIVDVTVTLQNLAPANGVAITPLHVGFNNGSYDAFNLGGVAGAPIISVAEGGVGDLWQAAFAAADPGATRGTIGGVLLPGMSSNATFRIDTTRNPFFTFAAMVIPSNDFFIGNDSPTAFRLFDASGNLAITTIGIRANQIWDAGSEVFDPAAAAFVGNNDLRTGQGSVVALNFGELAGFNGMPTAAGYTFNSGLRATSDVYRISFQAAPVPEPQTYGLMLAGLSALGVLVRRRGARAGSAALPVA